MNDLEKVLLRTRKTIREGCSEIDMKFEDAVIEHIQECSSCNIWFKKISLIPDLDGNPICKNCAAWYGM